MIKFLFEIKFFLIFKVRFIYTAQVKVSESNKTGLLILSYAFQVDSLSRLVQDYINCKVEANRYDIVELLNLVKLAFDFDDTERDNKNWRT